MYDGAMIAVVMRVPMIERKRGLNRAAQANRGRCMNISPALAVYLGSFILLVLDVPVPSGDKSKLAE